MKLSRRQFSALTIPALAVGQAPPQNRGLKIVCVGGHPDDPESGCGGTLARYAELGHSVTVIYLTRGEAGIPGKSHDEAATIRSAECLASCKILGAKPVFAGQIDGATVVDAKSAESFGRILSAERPNVVFTQWPIDTHLDHQAASTLTFRAWIATGRGFGLYYYEVNLGSQTMGFHPTDYVDITIVREKKKAGSVCPQKPERRRNLPQASRNDGELSRTGSRHHSRRSFRTPRPWEWHLTAARPRVVRSGRPKS
jgi:LmbE family N-acetylglucosaminyl deacetylase